MYTLKTMFNSGTGELLDESLENYASLRNYSKGSRRQFARAMMHHCNANEMTPMQLLEEAMVDEDNHIRMTIRKINTRLTKLKKHLSDLAPITQKNVFNTVVHWYKMNDVQIPSAVRSNDKVTTLKENRYIPTPDDIRLILEEAKTPRNKAIILVQISSGMGNAELLSIKREEFLEGIDYDTYITTLHPVRGKTQQPYTTFCSPEATKAVLYYLEKYDGEMLFPLEEKGLIAVYRRITSRLYEKQKGVYSKYRSHNMRKFFNNQMMNHGMPRDLVWFFSGRCENETQKAYVDYGDNYLKEQYMNFVKHVSVTEVVRDLLDHKEILAELRKTHDDNIQLGLKYNELEAELYEMKKLVGASDLYKLGNDNIKKVIERKVGEM